MGFFDNLGKLLFGGSIEQPPQAPRTPQGQSTPLQSTMSPQRPSSGVIDEHGRKIIPHISLKDLHSHRNGDRFTVTTWVVNQSDQRLRIDDTYLLKQKRSLHLELAPGQSHEVRLYDGPVLDNENEHHAWITYRLMVNGDVFMENFRIHYVLEHDGKHTVGDLIGDGPIRDV